AIMLMLLTIFSKILGLTRDITLSYFYGASGISDAYLISITIPGTIFAFIGTGIATTFIPLYSNIENTVNTKSADRFTNNILNLTLVICSCLIVCSALFTNKIVGIFASGFEEETLKLAVTFTRISLFGIYFSGLVFIFTSYLRMKNKFVIPALIGVPLNLFTIISIAASSKYSLLLLAVGSIIATASQLLLLIPSAYKSGFRYNPILEISDKNVKQMMFLSMPVILGTSVNEINKLIDRSMASQIAVGGISALNYAHKIDGFIQGIFVMSIVTVMYPMIAKMAAENNISGLKKTLSESISGINLLLVPATIGVMVFAEPIVLLLFGRGAFDEEAVSMTSNALFYYAFGLMGFGLREVLNRVFFSLQDTKTPMINAVISMVINIILIYILSKYFGIGGLALATSISAIVCTLLLFVNLRKKIGSYGLRSIILSFGKMVLASLLMVFIAKGIFNIIIRDINSDVSLMISISIGALVYIIIIYYMKIEGVDSLMNNIWRKLIKK
ncbi:murein biosynthesis integral membrane protein MurJ, partial [Bacillus sp. RHFB]|nr:murein biosynthesis integral membrane protein MurJ [Bacillus sp. RHFB]